MEVQMKKKIIPVIQILLVLIILYSSYRIFDHYKTNKDHDNKQAEIINVSKEWEEKVEKEMEVSTEKGLPEPTEDELASSRINHLQSEYKNVIGWIKIPGTNIDYPFVKGKNNEYFFRSRLQKRL